MAHIVIVNPRFEPSYWGYEYVLPALGVKANTTSACLSLLAALTPKEHRVTVIDENIEDIDYDLCAKADIVALTGMSVQRRRMKSILTKLRESDRLIAVGGPWVTVSEDYFGNLVDVKFIGEAEQTWPQFLTEWSEGTHAARYEQATRTDMTQVPTPDWSVLKMGNYLYGTLQISRGCPFTCEFCDIIQTFGRLPRLKTSAQVMQELDALKAAGMHSVVVVDDNLIGNKKAIKPILRDIADWQERNGFPFRMMTEASIDLADDPELVEMMVATNMRYVFIGVESPNEASLRETKKLQNVRKGRTMLEKIHDIQKRGLEITAGMIVGFDSDDSSIFQQQIEFVNKSRIINAMVGMLYAIPKTPLFHRLAREGRLDEAGEATYGTNVVPTGMKPAELLAGYNNVTAALNEVDVYFDRVDSIFLDLGMQPEIAKRKYLRNKPWARVKSNFRWLAAGAMVATRVLSMADRKTRVAYARRIGKALVRRPLPVILAIYAGKAAIHYHTARMIDDASTGRRIQGTI